MTFRSKRSPRRAAGVSAASSSPAIFIEGTWIAHPKGFGFVKPCEPGPDVFVPAFATAGALPGDRVLAKVGSPDDRGRVSGRVDAILASGSCLVVGRLVKNEALGWRLAPLDPEWPSIALPQVPSDAEDGALASCVIVARDPRQGPSGRVDRVIGAAWTADSILEAAATRLGLPMEFSSAVLAESQSLADTVSAAETEGRLDARTWPLVTIDGASSRDFDDAVFAQRIPGGYRLVVAIADVAHYVHPGSALDDEARSRATSVYVPGAVVPMLPEKLSNGICSLNPGVDRLCLLCDMTVTDDGALGTATFHNAVMRSHARLTYDAVADALAHPDRATPPMASLLPHLTALQEVYKALRSARDRRGALEFDSPEVEIMLDAAGRPEGLAPRSRNEAHCIVEEAMIAANVQAARFLIANEAGGLFRVHNAPDTRRVDELRGYLASKGIDVPEDTVITPSWLAGMLSQTRHHASAAGIAVALFRTQGKATYQPDNGGHFGLGLEAYAHFTSPIRRYPDTLVHRAIKTVLAGYRPDLSELADLAERCSECERRAQQVEREAVDRHRAVLLSAHVGKEFDAHITGVQPFGVFVEFDDSRASALLPIAGLPEDTYTHDAVGQSLAGATHRFDLGQPLKVRLSEACPERSRLTVRLRP